MADITELNGAKYEYEYTLSNNTGEVKFRDSAVDAIEITDNLFDPFADGYITFTNPYNVIEKDFLLRGDGSDKLTIKLNPKSDRKKALEYKFIIIQETNIIDDGTPAKNKKTYLFTDEDEIKLRSAFTYSMRGRGKCGNMIKDLLKLFKLEVDEKVFEPGDFIVGDNPEFIIPGINYRYLDFLYYLLQHYYFKDGDTSVKAFLSKDKNGKYQLKTLTKDIFAKNKDLLYEAFHTGDPVDSMVSNPNNSPPDNGEYKTFINNVTNINLITPAMDISNTFFMNSLVVGYDPMLGSSRMAEVRIKDVRDKWKKKFVSVFKSIGGEVKYNINLTETKKAGEFKTYRLPFSINDNINIVEADMINNLTFYNYQLNINVVGDTGRKSGTFIDIFKGKNDKTKSDEKLLGRWLVTSVRHVKLGNTYRNEIFCTKTYAGPNFKEKDA